MRTTSLDTEGLGNLPDCSVASGQGESNGHGECRDGANPRIVGVVNTGWDDGWTRYVRTPLTTSRRRRYQIPNVPRSPRWSSHELR